MELTIEQTEIAKRIKAIRLQMDLIYFELESIQSDFYNETKNEQARLLAVCEDLDSKAFCFEMELKDLINELNSQGITNETHPNIFPLRKNKANENQSNDNLLEDLPF